MEIIKAILLFASGVSLGAFLTYKFRRPTTQNNYSGNVKIKQKGQNNEMGTELETYIRGTRPHKFRKDRRSLIKNLKK